MQSNRNSVNTFQSSPGDV